MLIPVFLARVLGVPVSSGCTRVATWFSFVPIELLWKTDFALDKVEDDG